ncbi:DUF501 domain-containing protein [Thermosipho atlanticus]|uniref:DUF501 domain-containing protein n=1 Tax=Thermosipho atlanticus DSM 15807 TaxID=1123380 RepID=A0A1M5RY54_9BACT|nr:DUF501 domain-containing protein [Thermosipho atlanticus]SHH31130.1 hypothetical protein SAMN02745199_0689 [Thermosipho atlanticus DSM 15807]
MEFLSDKALRKIVNKQLEVEATNFWKVAYFCIYNFPVVIESLPIKNGKPFPTIHYLTCPYLLKEISRLEEKGFIKYFEQKIENDEKFREKVFEAHIEVIEKRRKFFETVQELKRYELWKEKLLNVGTGGIRDWTKVKCLHLHTADYLSGIKNPIGEEVVKLIKKTTCNDRYCKKFLEE